MPTLPNNSPGYAVNNVPNIGTTPNLYPPTIINFPLSGTINSPYPSLDPPKNELKCIDYPQYFKDFEIIDNPVFMTYNLIKNNLIKNNGSLYPFVSPYITNTHYTVNIKLKTIRLFELDTDLLNLESQQLNTILEEIVKELKTLNYTHLYKIVETITLYNPNTFQGQKNYIVNGLKIPPNKQNDGLSILNNYVKSKEWYEPIKEPFSIITIKDKDYYNPSNLSNDKLILKFDRKCANKIYSKYSFTKEKWIELDQYLIEIINNLLKEYNVEEILFTSSDNSDLERIEYIKLRDRWIVRPKYPIMRQPFI